MTVKPASDFRDLLRAEVLGPVEQPIAKIAELARARHGVENTSAILFYGSCLRRGYEDGDVIDLYVVVERYRSLPASPLAIFLNWVLPPNVFYLEADTNGRTIRAKCAVISMEDFEKGASGNWFHSYLWARFAQPLRAAYMRDDRTLGQLLRALEGAARTVVREGSPLMAEPFGSDALWRRAFQETYRAELRAEDPSRAAELVNADHQRYEKITRALCAEGMLQRKNGHTGPSPIYLPGSSKIQRHVAGFKWFLRRLLGKLLSVLRLMKAAFTFHNGTQYILWKIERHTGVSIEVSNWQKRHPILASTTLFWRLYRNGAFK